MDESSQDQGIYQNNDKKGRKGKISRTSYDSSNSDISSDEESWRSGMNRAGQMHILASTGTNSSDSDIEFDKNELQRCKKQAKKWSKN